MPHTAWHNCNNYITVYRAAMAGNFSLPYPRSVGEGSIRALPFERLARAHSVEEREFPMAE